MRDSGRGERRAGLWAYYWVYLVFLYAPLLVLAAFSFHDSSILGLPWQGFSLRWYRAMLDSSALLGSLRVSLMVATMAAAVALVLGSLAAIAAARFRFRGRGGLLAVGLMPLVIPYLGLAVALLLSFLALGIRPSLMPVTIAHSVIAIPYVLLLASARLAGFDARLEEAAMDLGASWARIVARVHVPLMRPALLSAFVSAFVVSFDEFYLAFFLAGSDQTLPVYFFSGLRRTELLPPTLALVTLFTIATVSLLLTAQAVTRRLAGREAG